MHEHSSINSDMSAKKVFIAMAMNLVITAVEFIGGLISGSLSLMSDALHNFSDALSILLTYAAIKMGNVAKTEKFTFGLKRAEILAAVINASVLIVISVFLFIEAIGRFFQPEKVSGLMMMIVALIALVANIVSTIMLKEGSETSINIKATYIHLLTDAVTSVGVIIGGICIYFFGITWIDPLLTIIIGLYILKESIPIVKQAVVILMMGKPEGISLEDIKTSVESLPKVVNMHHSHLWMLTDSINHLEAHVDVEKELTVEEAEGLLHKIEDILHDKFEIEHTTIQFEVSRCDNKKMI